MLLNRHHPTVATHYCKGCNTYECTGLSIFCSALCQSSYYEKKDAKKRFFNSTSQKYAASILLGKRLEEARFFIRECEVVDKKLQRVTEITVIERDDAKLPPIRGLSEKEGVLSVAIRDTVIVKVGRTD